MSTLLSLPTVVWSKILDCMDLYNLKKLRCVCKQTKNMVEQPKYLQKFKVQMRKLDESEANILSSVVPWNNFRLGLNTNGLPEFLTQFGKSIEHLEFQDWRNNIQIILSHLTPKIQTLIIGDVDTNPLTFQSPIWANNFAELKKLHIEVVKNFPDAPKTLFEIILDNCTHHLTHLKIPCLTGSFQNDHLSEITQVHYNTLIFQPVLNYLKRIEVSQVQTSLIIDFMGLEQLHSDILLSIVAISSRLGVKLLHVPIDGFPMDNQSLTSDHREMFEKSIMSVVEFVNMKHSKSNKNKYIPKKSHIIVEVKMYTHRNCCGGQNFHGYEIRGPIYYLDVLSCSSGFPNLHPNYPDLFQTRRATVEKLQISYFQESEGSRLMHFGQDISSSFPNLKELVVSGCSCMRTQDFNALFNGLPSLEDLGIETSNLSDDGLLGVDHTRPLILRMTRLKHLALLCCNELTDVSFTTAFRFMKLHTFRWTYEDYEPCHVTFANGISSLNSIDGGLKDSVQHLEFKSTGDCSKEEVDEFVNKFKCLSYFNMRKFTRVSYSESVSESEEEDAMIDDNEEEQNE